jgi:phosphate transport system substrate-binding protein
MRRLLVPLAATALLVAACGNDNSDRTSELTSARADTSVSGTITVTGSSTVEPVSTVAAEAFRGHNDDVDISVDGPGTGDGFERLCEGAADIAGASRPIEADELEACAAAGIEVIELAIGLDGVAVITALDNEVECLSFADLYALVGVEAEGVDTWAEGREVAAELGSTTTLPDERLVVTGPGEESGTYDTFLSVVLEQAAEPRVEEGAVTEDEAASARSDYASSADDNAIIEAVAGERGGLGWVGLSYAEMSEDIREVPIRAEADGECVAPGPETVQDGTYPISRTLYIYVDAERAERPEVAAFVDFYLAGLADFLEFTDYVAQPDPDATVARWEARTTGSASA